MRLPYHERLKILNEVYDTVVIKGEVFDKEDYIVDVRFKTSSIDISYKNQFIGIIYLSDNLTKFNSYGFTGLDFEIVDIGNGVVFRHYTDISGTNYNDYNTPLSKDDYFNITVQSDIKLSLEEIQYLIDNYIPKLVFIYE